jgi:hypothetical protein
MSLINISIPWATSDTGVISVTATYQRVDNSATVTNPVITVAGLTTSPADLTPSGVPNGQYAWTLTPVYADGRVCAAQASGIRPPCASMISVSAAQVGNNIVVTYTAPPTVATVQVTITTPSGGTFVNQYTNGNAIVYAIPTGVYGAYSVSMQCVCDTVTGFYGPSASGGTVNVAAPITNPSLSGTLTIVPVGNCSGLTCGNLVFNLTQPLANDLTVQMAYTLTSPTGALEPIQQYGCTLIPSQYQAGTCVMSSYASFIIPGGVLQATIPSSALVFGSSPQGGSGTQCVIAFCESNPDYSTIYVSQIFFHPANQPSLLFQITPIDNRITIIQV